MRNINLIFGLLSLTFTACSAPTDPIDSANIALKAQLASDITIEIDRNTEKYFHLQQAAPDGSGTILDYVCGTATVDQPGLHNHSKERFIVTIANGKPGLTLFDGGGDSPEAIGFEKKWNTSCPGMSVTAPKSSSNEGVAQNELALPKGDLDSTTLVRYANAAMQFKKSDEFTKEFDDKPLLGKKFKVELNYDKYKSSLKYNYDAEKELLTFDISPEPNSHRDSHPSKRMDYIILNKQSHFEAPIPMSNFLGVTKNVTPANYNVIGIGSPENIYMGIIPKYSIAKDIFTYKNLSKTINLPPESARKAVEGLTYEIEGVIKKPADGQIITCTHSEINATLDFPYQETWNECIISANLTRIAIKSPQLGVISEWHSKTR